MAATTPNPDGDPELLDDHDELHWQFGERTIRVGALRARSMFRRSSYRLLADMVDVLPESGEGIVRDDVFIRHAAQTSPCLLYSLDLPKSDTYARFRQQQRSDKHLLWLCNAADTKGRLEALGQLLAAALAEQFDEQVGLVSFDAAGARLQRHSERGVEEVGRFQSLDALLDHDSDLRHLLFLGSMPPSRLPKQFRDLEGRMDRVVYISQHRPQDVPTALTRLLRPQVRRRVKHINENSGAIELEKVDSPSGPFFTSFVTAIVGLPPAERFRTAPVDEDYQAPHRQRKKRPGWRLGRDLCRLHFDLDRIDALWAESERGDSPSPFPARVFADSEAAKQTAWRWARAVTNRCVGVALSGGGASSYRFVPLLRRLHANHVPVDVVGGVSGGALIGAYYCAHGLPGLDRCLESGWRVQIGVIGSVFLADAFRWMLSRDLGAARVEQCEVRFVPVATVLREGRPLAAHMVMSGSMGKAVEVSGAAPVMFAPSTYWSSKHDANGAKRSWWEEATQLVSLGVHRFVRQRMTRYSDGGTAILIPARVLKDCGADFVFAFNCLAGPRQANPLEMIPGGDLLYHATPIGRLADLLVSASYLQQQLGREAGEDADLYFEPQATPIPFIEGLQFARATEIAAAADASKEIHECAERCRKVWDDFRRRPLEE